MVAPYDSSEPGEIYVQIPGSGSDPSRGVIWSDLARGAAVTLFSSTSYNIHRELAPVTSARLLALRLRAAQRPGGQDDSSYNNVNIWQPSGREIEEIYAPRLKVY